MKISRCLKCCMCPTAQITGIFHFPVALPLHCLYVQIFPSFPDSHSSLFPFVSLLWSFYMQRYRWCIETLVRKKEGFFFLNFPFFPGACSWSDAEWFRFFLSCFAADIVVFVTKMHRPAPALTNKSAFHGWLNLIELSTRTKGTKGINLFH